MRLWDLNSDLLFPKSAIIAYVKSLLRLSGSTVDVRALVTTMSGYHWLKGVNDDGREVDIYAPFTVSGVRRMFIPFVVQRSILRTPEFRWSADGSKTFGCMRIGNQEYDNEFWLMTSRSAVVAYARSGKPRGILEADKYRQEVQDFIDKSLDDPWIEETFRFADIDGRTRVVPFLPIVLNQGIATENRNARTALPDYTKKGREGRR